MSKNFKWKDHLLKSGLPLEYEVKEFLDKKGCISSLEYSYLRQNEKNYSTEFSYDIDSSYIKKDYFIDLMIECKYRHESTKWLFLPEEYNGIESVSSTSFLNPNDHFTSKNKFPFKSSTYKFPIKLGPLCSKGIELTLDGQNPKTISQSIAQLSYAMGEKIASGMQHQVLPDLKTHFGETIFCYVPIIVTTASLFRANPDISIDQIKKAENIEDISKEENLLIIKTTPSIELKEHTKSAIQETIKPYQRELFEKSLNSFSSDLDFVISNIARYNAPSCVVVIKHSKDNNGINKLFDYLERIIEPDNEIYELIKTEKERLNKMFDGF